MKIQLVSDLHLEFSDINIQNKNHADVLILSGDIMIANDLHDHPAPVDGQYNSVNIPGLGRRQIAAQRFRDFLKRCSSQFPHVVYIAGNHEFYHGKWHASLEHLNDECLQFPNIHFLENQTWEYKDYTFIGCTLWTDMNKGDPVTLHAIGEMMNDYQVIRNDHQGFRKLKPLDTVERHRKSLAYIKHVVKNDVSRQYIVVGHHAPTHASQHPRFKDDRIGNGAYQSDLSEFIMDHPQIKLWTHGHTHNAFDYMCGETRVVCNPRGYEGYEPSSGWDPNFIIAL